MKTLIINDLDGIQKLLIVDRTGNYFDPNRVIYDSKLHGEPSSTVLSQVGGLSRDGNGVLQFNASAKALNDTKISDTNSSRATDETDRLARLSRLSDISSANTVTQLRSIVDDLIDQLRLR